MTVFFREINLEIDEKLCKNFQEAGHEFYRSEIHCSIPLFHFATPVIK